MNVLRVGRSGDLFHANVARSQIYIARGLRLGDLRSRHSHSRDCERRNEEKDARVTETNHTHARTMRCSVRTQKHVGHRPTLGTKLFSEPFVLRKVPKGCFGGKIKRHAEVMIYIGDGRRRLTSNINRFSTDLKGLFAVGSEFCRFCVGPIDFGSPLVHVLRRKVHLGSTAAAKSNFMINPNFTALDFVP